MMVCVKSKLSRISISTVLTVLTLGFQNHALLAQCAIPIGSSSASSVNTIQPLNISSPFGWRTDPINGTSRFHAGIDLPAQTGTPVLAAQSGYVVFSGVYGDYGQTVVIDHGSSLYTLYGHNSERLVNPGQYVKAGQPIARVGSTGRVTGPHLHFEVHYNKQYLNPADYLGSYFKIPLGPMDMLPPVIASHPAKNTTGAIQANAVANQTTDSNKSSAKPTIASADKHSHGLFYGLFHRKPKVVQHIDPKERTIPLSWDNNGPSSVISWKDTNSAPPIPGHPRVQMVTGNKMETVEF
jgi:Peptidase family M23